MLASAMVSSTPQQPLKEQPRPLDNEYETGLRYLSNQFGEPIEASPISCCPVPKQFQYPLPVRCLHFQKDLKFCVCVCACMCVHAWKS